MKTNNHSLTKKNNKRKVPSLKAKGLIVGKTHINRRIHRIKVCPIHNHEMSVRILDYTKNKVKPVVKYACYECRDELIRIRQNQRLIDEMKTRLARERRIWDVKEYRRKWDEKTRGAQNVLPNKIK